MTGRHDPYAHHRPKPMPVLAVGRDLAEGPCVVLAVVDRYPPGVNAGAEWMLHRLLADSARRGHRVIVATPCTDEGYEIDGVEVYPAADGISEGRDAEVVIGHLAWTHHAIEHAIERRLPLVYLMHNDDQARWWGMDRDRASIVVWNSVWLAGRCRADDALRGIPGTIIRPAVHRDPPEATTREFVTIVNPIHAKGAETFYRVARSRPDLRFLAVEGAYGNQIPPGPLDRNVEWQAQTADMPGDVWARTRVLLAPSMYESWGLAACEALAAGVPVIAAPTPGLVESLGDAATFVPWDDPAGWVAALAALDDPLVYAQASEAALARAETLQIQAARDLDRWDTTIRLAAGATRVRSGAMTTRPFDPYSHAAPADEDPAQEPATPPEQPQEGAEAVPGTETPEEAPEAQSDAQGPAPEPWEVPDKAADIVVALRQTDDPDERRARAEAVQAAEATRPDGPRQSVTRAVAEILG